MTTTHSPSTNGSAVSALREKRAANRLIVEEIRGKRLESMKLRAEKRAAMESLIMYDWVGPYVDLIGMSRRDPEVVGPTASWHRRRGMNYPLFQSEQELALLRAPARILEATNDYAQRLAAGVIAYGVGTGFIHRVAKKKVCPSHVPDALPAACQAIIDEFHERTDWFGGEQPAMEEELWQRGMFDGEFLLCHFPKPNGLTEVRTVEPEQLTIPPGADPREYSFGIRTPRDDTQDHQAYWVQWGETPVDGEEIDAERMTHVRFNVKRSIKRGLTDFCFGTLDGFDLAGKLRTNLADAAAQQAAIVGITQHDSGTKTEIEAVFGAGGTDTEVDEVDRVTGTTMGVRKSRRGEWEHIPKGQNYVSPPTAGNAPIHIQVLQSCLRGAGGRYQPPEWLISGDASNNNFASALVASSPFVKVILARQKRIGNVLRKTDVFVLKHWCAKHGGVVADGKLYAWTQIQEWLDILVEGPSPIDRNHLEEAQRAAIEVPLGVDSRQRYAQSQGRDFDQIEADNDAWESEHGGQGEPLPLPGEMGGSEKPKPTSAFESLLESLLECGGKGGEPGPCAKGGGSDGGSADKGGTGGAGPADWRELKDHIGEEASNPGAWEAIKKVHAKVQLAVLTGVNTVLSKAHELAPAILDTAEDYANPLSGANKWGQAGSAEFMSTFGISPSVGMKVAAFVLSKAVTFAKRKLLSSLESVSEPNYEAMAGHVIELLQAVHDALGLPFEPPDAGEVEGKLKAKMQAAKES